MQILQRASQRGGGKQGWLDTRHSFSFADWYDPRHMQWGPLRVINEDRVAAGSGFGTHAHKDMEIVTYVLGGVLHHRDSTGSDGIIRPGIAQRMSAGSGVRHSEWNDGDTETHLLQIWLLPAAKHLGIQPSYEQKQIPAGAREEGWHAVAEGRESQPCPAGTVHLRQDAALMASILATGHQRAYSFAPGRLGYLFVVEGSVSALENELAAGDSIRFSGVTDLVVRARSAAHVLLFDLPPS